MREGLQTEEEQQQCRVLAEKRNHGGKEQKMERTVSNLKSDLLPEGNRSTCDQKVSV